MRFHLKQAALQSLGQVDNPSATECDFVTGLLRDPGWRDHTSDHVLWGNGAWFDALDDRGEWRESLASNDEARAIFALQLMRVVAAGCGERVARLLAPYVDAGGEWPRRCAFVLPFDPSEDSDALFELRLRLVRHGEGRELVYLPDLARKCPRRFIRLVELNVDRRLVTESPEAPGSTYDRLMDDLERIDRKQRIAFRAAGRAERGLALDLLLPSARRIASASNGLRAFNRYGLRVIPACLAECLVAAAAAELHRDPDRFFGRIESIAGSEPNGILTLILSALTYGPDTIADRALGWVLSRPASLRSGDRFEMSEWEPARRLMHRFSRRCADAAYAEVEDFLLRYTDDDGGRSMIRRHEWAREGRPTSRTGTDSPIPPPPGVAGSSKVWRSRRLGGQVLPRKFAPHKDSMFSSHRSRPAGTSPHPCVPSHTGFRT